MLSEMFLFGMLPEEAHALPLTGGQYKLEPAMEAMETETPKTDAIKYVQSDPGNGTGVYTFQGHYSAAITLCSQLERELTAAHEQIASLKADAERCRHMRYQHVQRITLPSIVLGRADADQLDDLVDASIRALQEKAK